jgi:hypothetical protein
VRGELCACVENCARVKTVRARDFIMVHLDHHTQDDGSALEGVGRSDLLL